MTALLRSIAVRFPLLLGSIVLLVALVTARLVEREIGAVLISSRSASLGDGARQVSAMLGSTVPSLRADRSALSSNPSLRLALQPGVSDGEAERRLRELVEAAPAEAREVAQLIGAGGRVRAEVRREGAASPFTWASEAASRGQLPADSLALSAILPIDDSLPGYAVAAPVLAADGRLLGWYAELRRAVARGVDDVRGLIGVPTMLVGSAATNVWSDLERIVPAPAMTGALGSAQRVNSDLRGDALGYAMAVPGTPWTLWIEEPVSDVLAPMDAFFRRMWPAVTAIALLGAFLAWLLARYASVRIRTVAGELDRTLVAHGAVGSDRGAESSDELRTLEQSYARLEARLAERKRIDEQLLQAQKLEAVGRLAGGIAHDFNNLLTVMGNYGEFVRQRLAPGSPEAEDMKEVLHASERATALTRQLLSFSRQRLSDARPLSVNEVIQDVDRMLTRLIPSNVVHELSLADKLPLITADRVQIEQILMNLVLNAADAMPDGGRLAIRTSEETLEPITPPDGIERIGGSHVCIAVSDTGVGMDAETVARVFDPFFTTKPLGKGTGLGLATVHGIVTEAGGRVWAYSEPGNGTTMKVYLPVAEQAAEASSAPSRTSPVPLTSSGLILVVEDDDGTRRVLCRLLKLAGHAVHDVNRADAALEWLRSRRPETMPVLVLSDVMMPGMSGVEFTRALQASWPTLPVVLVSGYTDIRERADAVPGRRPVVLEKPFTAAALREAVQRAIQR